jgi:hypothetical protein
MTLIIGLCGKARHGKGSVVQLSQILLQTGDDELEVRQVSFATELKTIAADLVLLADNKLAFLDYLRLRGMPLTVETSEVIKNLQRMALELTLADLKAKTPKARKFLQYLGTEAFRVHVDGLYWVKVAAEKASEMPEETKLVFIPDCRFINEADYIRKTGGLLWRVERLNRDGTPFDNGLTAEQKMHPSETQLDGYSVDAVLKACNMEELFNAVKAQIGRLQREGRI